jgi:hypothetical protein
MSSMKSSSSFSPMTFRDYIHNFFISSCGTKDNTGWGWFIDIEQNCKCTNDKKYKTDIKQYQTITSTSTSTSTSTIKTKKSYSDMQSDPDLMFLMDEDYARKTSFYKKMTCNIIGIIVVTTIYIILL